MIIPARNTIEVTKSFTSWLRNPRELSSWVYNINLFTLALQIYQLQTCKQYWTHAPKTKFRVDDLSMSPSGPPWFANVKNARDPHLPQHRSTACHPSAPTKPLWLNNARSVATDSESSCCRCQWWSHVLHPSLGKWDAHRIVAKTAGWYFFRSTSVMRCDGTVLI